jgi:hypothetical protein
MVRDALDFLLFSMKKQSKNLVGILLLDHLKDHAQGLYNHLMNKPIGASPLMKCCFSHYLFWLRRILWGMGGGGLKKRGEHSVGYRITEM